ncbi:nucleoside deaminase [Photorhabdus heterorhabditis]|uniref:Nucleoside deaminase n=2 Tax=Photorhabdus heterorhabditis TaxID=880156 RepID=A0A5B0WSZ8_9GAMM|nr:nucleoside deaminase [Photorhabdus heterorhabditis]KAA1190190.1 nucleoside deaminase [Photorhabdus heterorhabditis]MBS9440660.1 nucleoside deaminase [Photorhabdus heterorhabditis]
MNKTRRKLLAMPDIMSANISFVTQTGENKTQFTNNILSEQEIAKHEKYMREAIEEAKKSAKYPFGAVIVNRNSGEILSRGVNSWVKNPILHGEIQAINHYVTLYGNQGWNNVALYTTAEPCSMCMSALVWTGIREVIWATSISGLRNMGIRQIDISAQEIAERASSFYSPISLVGGILANETDKLFSELRKKN